MLTTAQIKQ